MAQFTEAQFQKLLKTMGNIVRNGSFSHCTARFHGQRDPAAVEEFLTAITVCKDIEHISDADALTGLQLLLEGYAANWWIGVKSIVSTFDNAKALIKTTFSPPMPDWRIFASIYEQRQQKVEPTDSFVCKKCLLFSQLKSTVAEEIQLNIIFGLLQTKIRELVRRENVTTFEELLSACREAEHALAEIDDGTTTTTPLAEAITQTKSALRCSFCLSHGHSADVCLKKKKRDEKPQEHHYEIEVNTHTIRQAEPQVKRSALQFL
ncbi:activity-regulated cytoskeleton associated protein 2-like [Musca autumnalis]|uniref:activity-regulated cytoskeleton associated protein 2-like n=1 Tax=Musca autumnalis TaxID=221902 RepID=UPI003CEDFCA8